MSTNFLVSIIICTCNRASDLRQTLSSLASMCVPEGMPTELVVVDNASTDDTAEVVKFYHLPRMHVRYVFEPCRGKGYAYNTGMAAARGEVFLFTDDDVRLPKKWIEGMCGPLLRGEADAIAGGVRLTPHLERVWMRPFHRSWMASTESIPPDAPDRMVGANMAFSRKVLEKVPAFDTELGPGALGFGDETLFSWQLMQAGFRLSAAFTNPVEHHCDASRITRAGFIKSAKSFGRTDAYLMHHWRHGTIPAGRVKMSLLKRPLLLTLKRAQEWRNRALSGPAPAWELALIQELAFYRQYLIERERPRNYAKYGITKIER